MNYYQVSWIDNEGLELYSGWIDYKNAINYAYLYQSQLGIQNTTKTQEYSPQGY